MNDTKQKLIEATRQMVDAGGVDSVSMREIGNRIHLSRGAVYRHFKSKEDLLAAIVVENFKALNKNIYDLIHRSDAPVEVLAALLKYYYDFAIKNRGQYRLMFGYEWNKELYPDVYNEAIKVFDIVSNSLEKAQQDNWIIKKPTKELTAVSYAFIHGLVELHFAGHNEFEKGLNEPYSVISLFISMLKS